MSIERLRQLASVRMLPEVHASYLKRMNIKPSVVYDIGACVLHWTMCAKDAWPYARFFVFEAMDGPEAIFQEQGLHYNMGVLSNVDGKEIPFYQNTEHPAGNSYYRENVELSPAAAFLFNDANMVMKTTMTLDTVVKEKGFLPPDLIKMDVQGAELDVLHGARNTLKTCKDLILELQNFEYNVGAPMKDVVIDYLDTIGFRIAGIISEDNIQGDYHFTRYK